MTDPFLAEIRMFGFDFPPRGWAHCNGQLMPIAQNTALFALLGTTYGGNGATTFALPNLQGAAPMHAGTGPGLSQRGLGDQGGTMTTTLIESEMPAHTHAMRAFTTLVANVTSPTATTTLARSNGGSAYAPASANVEALHPAALQPAGGDFPHNNLMPYLTLNFCIALQGVFPPRS